MKILIVVGIITLILILIVFSIIFSKKKMKREVLKIDEANNNIDLYLENKKKLLNEIIKLLDNEELSSFNEISFDGIDNIRMNELLEDYYNKLKIVLEDEEDITKDKELYKLLSDINDNNCNLYGSIKFYNDSINKYLLIKKRFPTKIVKIFCGFKKYDSYNIKTSKKNIY